MLISFPSIPLAAVLRTGQGTEEAGGSWGRNKGFWTYFEGTAKKMWDKRSREVGDDCRILGDRTGTAMRMSGTDCRPGSLCCHGQ